MDGHVTYFVRSILPPPYSPKSTPRVAERSSLCVNPAGDVVTPVVVNEGQKEDDRTDPDNGRRNDEDVNPDAG